MGALALIGVKPLSATTTSSVRRSTAALESPSSSSSGASSLADRGGNNRENNVAAAAAAGKLGQKCAAETEACVKDSECRECAKPRVTDYFDSNVACMHYYPTIRDPTAPRCHRAGVAQCCLSGPDPARSGKCMANELAARYFGCMMRKFECSMGDIPCYSVPAGQPGGGAGGEEG